MSKSKIVSIVDDDASVRAAMQSLVRSLGFVAFVFESAENFLRSPRVDDSSCLITDVQMPGMSGLDLQDCLIATPPRPPHPEGPRPLAYQRLSTRNQRTTHVYQRRIKNCAPYGLNSFVKPRLDRELSSDNPG